MICKIVFLVILYTWKELYGQKYSEANLPSILVEILENTIILYEFISIDWDFEHAVI